MATNNDGNLLDSSGNVFVDYVWGNFPAQPNDVRLVSPSQTVTAGGDQNASWTNYGTIASARLDYTKDSHAIVEAGWAGYPAFTASTGKYNITQVTGDGTTVRYEAYNFFNGGETVDITGCNSFNLTSATIATATRDYFTVTNSTTGSLININNGIVQRSDALSAADGAFVSGVSYVKVPNVVGLTTALAQDALADVELTVTTASAVTPAISNVALTSNVATITTAAAHGFAVGDLVTVAPVTATTLAATLVAIATVPSTTTFTYAKTTGNVASASDTGTARVPARTGTIKTQSIAAGAASIAPAAAITITPFA
jgi:hypothetical protein